MTKTKSPPPPCSPALCPLCGHERKFYNAEADACEHTTGLTQPQFDVFCGCACRFAAPVTAPVSTGERDTTVSATCPTCGWYLSMADATASTAECERCGFSKPIGQAGRAYDAVISTTSEHGAQRLLVECRSTISSLADQQAMPDDFYKGTLEAIDKFLGFVATSTTPDGKRDALVDEVELRMGYVVEAAVEWHQAGREGGEWLEAADKLGAAIDSLLELRDKPATTEVCGYCASPEHFQPAMPQAHFDGLWHRSELGGHYRCTAVAATEAGEQE